MKNYCRDKSKAFKAFTSTSTQDSKSFNQAKKDKKKKRQKNKRDSTKLTTGVNMTKVRDEKKKKHISKIMC